MEDTERLFQQHEKLYKGTKKDKSVYTRGRSIFLSSVHTWGMFVMKLMC